MTASSGPSAYQWTVTMSNRSPKSFITAANQPSLTPCQLTSGPSTVARGLAARIAARAVMTSER